MKCVGENNRRLKAGKRKVPYEVVSCKNLSCDNSFERRATDTKWEFCSKSCAYVEKREKCLRAPRAHLFQVTLKDDLKVYVRSRWEAIFIKGFLEPNELEWNFEGKTIILGDGKTHYTPDFYIKNDDVFVEIKGFRKSNAWKASAAREMGYNVILADKTVLQNVYGLDMREANLRKVCGKVQQ